MIRRGSKNFLHIENTAFVRIVTFANAVIGFIFLSWFIIIRWLSWFCDSYKVFVFYIIVCC
jgi:hypothetical protein